MLLLLARPSPGFCLLRRTVGDVGGCAPELAVSRTDVMALALRSSGQASGICWLLDQLAVTFHKASGWTSASSLGGTACQLCNRRTSVDAARVNASIISGHCRG